MSMANVQRVAGVFNEETFNSWLPNKNAIYTYDSFLRAVGKFPAFCGESNSSTYSEDDYCKRELSAFFTHVYHSSNGMSEVKDPACADSTSVTDCGFKTDQITSLESSFFYGRGPLALKGDVQYAAFSKAFFEGFDRSSDLLDDPNRVSDDGYTSFASALWKYMVPLPSQPSAHNVMSGFYVPNSSDLQAGHTAGFGTTIQIFDKTHCGTWHKSQGSIDRVNLFKSYEEDLGLAAETQNLNCERMWSDFAWGGSSNKIQYFSKKWDSEKC